ncbi:MAG: plastocyanin/azurin family copper-binding protein [Halovenus sp.]
MDRRTFLTVTGTGIATGLAGCLGISGGSTGNHDVGMSIDSFRPDSLTVTPGTTVEFLNTSSHTHTVTAFGDGIPEDAAYFASGGFGSEEAAREAWNDGLGGGLREGDSFEHTFEIPGRYDYFCIPHLRSDMVGVIHVEDD